MSDYHYTKEKLTYVADTLENYPGSVKDKLKEAMCDFAPLTIKEVPPKIMAEFLAVRQQLTSVKVVGGVGNFYDSIDAMTSEQANKLVEDITAMLIKLG